MKKILLTVVTVVVALSCIFAFVACGPKVKIEEADTTGYGDMPPAEAVVGNKIVAVDASMKADGEAMFLNAVANYDKSDYTSAWLVGQVDTEVLGINVSQMVDALRVRDHGSQYMYNNSWTKDGAFPDIRLMDNYYYDAATGKAFLIGTSGKKNVIFTEKGLAAKKWPIQKPFDSAEAFMKYNPNDPRVLNMYTLNKDTIIEVGTPVEKELNGMKYYTFHVKCDGAKAFESYLPVMKYMLDQQVSGAKIKDDGKELDFDVEIWENGLFKKYAVREAYKMSIAGIINGNIALNSDVLFNYDNTRDPIDNYYKDNKFVALDNVVTE